MTISMNEVQLHLVDSADKASEFIRLFVPVEAGNVFAIELGAQVPGHGWIYLEENALVTDDGAELVSTPQTELYLVRA